jgi:uncharacterized protein (DUF305 family)
MKIKIAAIIGTIVITGCSAQPEPAASNQAATAEPASTRALRKASASMHSGMDVRYTGNPDTDFLQAMIPHHQGAIEMARVELEHGRDPAVRALAKQVVDAQEAEIRQMREWLKKRRVSPSSGAKAHGDH